MSEGFICILPLLLIRKIEINDLKHIHEMKDRFIIDVRSPREYAHSRLPDAVNLSLLNNDERHIIGLTYKEKGHEEAVLKGFELVGGKFEGYIAEAKAISRNREIVLYCWRGGLRSNIMAWLMHTAGMKVSVISGGYKKFRNLVLKELIKSREWQVLAGKTGIGKTELLQIISDKGENVLDLEKLASHKGSTFGALGQPEQPSIEQFENNIAMQLASFDEKKIWIEDESRWIGKVKIPDAVFRQMIQSRTIAVERKPEIRKARLLKEYGIFPLEDLRERTGQLRKRLGGDRLQQAIAHLEEGNLDHWLDVLIPYYDKMYIHGLSSRELSRLTILDVEASEDMNQIAEQIIRNSK